MSLRKKIKSVTLIEVLLSIAIMGLLAGFTYPIVMSMNASNDLDVGTTTVAYTLNRARTLSKDSIDDANWGAKIETGKVTLYRGTSFSSRNTNLDEVSYFSPAISPKDISEINFTKFSGDPNLTGIITLKSSVDREKTIQINTSGVITY